MPKFSPSTNCGCCGTGYPAWTLRHDNVSDYLHFYSLDFDKFVNGVGTNNIFHYFYESGSGNLLTYSLCNINNIAFTGVSYMEIRKLDYSMTGFYPQTWLKSNRIEKFVISGTAGSTPVNSELNYDASLEGFVFGSSYQGLSGITGALNGTIPNLGQFYVTPMIGGRASSLNEGTQIIYNNATGEIDATYYFCYACDGSSILSGVVDRTFFRSYFYPLEMYFGTGPNISGTNPKASYSDTLSNFNLWAVYPYTGTNFVSDFRCGEPPICALPALGLTPTIPELIYISTTQNTRGYIPTAVQECTGSFYGISYPVGLTGGFKKITETPILSAYGITTSGSGYFQYNLMVMSNTGSKHILEEWRTGDYYTTTGDMTNCGGRSYNSSLVLTAINQYIAPSSDLCL